jgi:hypothetical protein
MAEVHRFSDRQTNEAIARTGAAAIDLYSAASDPVWIAFPVNGAAVDIAHGLGAVPDGYVLLGQDATVTRVRGQAWTRDTAYLQADADDSRALVIFVVCRQAPRNVGGVY